MMNRSKPKSRFSSWIFNSYSPSAEGLGLYRIFSGLFILLFLLPSCDLYPFISSLPNDFFVPPPGPMMLFDGFPAYGVFLLLHGLLILSLCMMTLGWQTVKTSLLSGLLILILQGFLFSLGKINHELLLAVLPMVMAFSGWGSAYSVDSYLLGQKKRAEGWTLTLLALIIGFMFFTAGFSKLIGGWLGVESQATIGHFLDQYFVKARQDLMAGYALKVTNPFVWELFDYATVFFEVGFIFALLHSRATRIFVCLAVLFHFSTMLVLNISFLPNFLAYAAFLNWDLVNDGIKNMNLRLPFFQTQKRWAPPALIILGFIIFYLIIQLLDRGVLLQSDWGMPGIAIVFFAMPIAIFHLMKELKKMVQ